MPTRYLKPGIRDSEAIDRLSPLAECLYYRLLVTVDDFGRYDARPSMIKSACYPVKESVTSAKCEALLKEIADCGLILVYQVDGKPYLQVRKWDNAPRSKESKYPQPDDTCIQVHADVCNPSTVLPVTVTVTGTVTKTETVNASPRKRDAHTAVSKPDDLDEQIWKDWLTLRKAKRLPLTATAWDDTRAEGAKVGLTPAQTVSHAVRSNWAGFRATWYERDNLGKPSFAQQAADVARTTVPAKTGRDPVLLQIEEDRAKAVPPSLEVLERMAKLRAAA